MQFNSVNFNFILDEEEERVFLFPFRELEYLMESLELILSLLSF